MNSLIYIIELVVNSMLFHKWISLAGLYMRILLKLFWGLSERALGELYNRLPWIC